MTLAMLLLSIPSARAGYDPSRPTGYHLGIPADLPSGITAEINPDFPEFILFSGSAPDKTTQIRIPITERNIPDEADIQKLVSYGLVKPGSAAFNADMTELVFTLEGKNSPAYLRPDFASIYQNYRDKEGNLHSLFEVNFNITNDLWHQGELAMADGSSSGLTFGNENVAETGRCTLTGYFPEPGTTVSLVYNGFKAPDEAVVLMTDHSNFMGEYMDARWSDADNSLTFTFKKKPDFALAGIVYGLYVKENAEAPLYQLFFVEMNLQLNPEDYEGVIVGEPTNLPEGMEATLDPDYPSSLSISGTAPDDETTITIPVDTTHLPDGASLKSLSCWGSVTTAAFNEEGTAVICTIASKESPYYLAEYSGSVYAEYSIDGDNVVAAMNVSFRLQSDAVSVGSIEPLQIPDNLDFRYEIGVRYGLNGTYPELDSELKLKLTGCKLPAGCTLKLSCESDVADNGITPEWSKSDEILTVRFARPADSYKPGDMNRSFIHLHAVSDTDPLLRITVFDMGCYLTIPDAYTGINGVEADGTVYDVYNLAGVCIARGATAADVSGLAGGVYILRDGNGRIRKVSVK